MAGKTRESMGRAGKAGSAAAVAASSRGAPRFASGATLYAQLASVLRGRVVAGELAPGQSLPTLEELIAQYGVSRITVRQALRVLADEGLISNQRGRRARVAPRPRRSGEDIEPLFDSITMPDRDAPDYSIRVLGSEEVAELPAGRWPVGVARGPYLCVRKVDSSGGWPYAWSRIYILKSAWERAPRGAERHMRLMRLVMKHAPQPITQGRERVRVAPAEFEEAELLECAMAQPVVRVQRVFCDAAGTVVYYAASVYRGDRYGLDRDLGEYFRTG